jgi:hypothetical protein
MVDNVQAQALGQSRRDISAERCHLSRHRNNSHDDPLGKLMSTSTLCPSLTAQLPFGSEVIAIS